MGYYLNYDLISFLSFYLGTCFLGLFAWESANAIRKVSPYLLLLASIAVAVISIILVIMIPIDPNYYGFILARVPFYLTVLVGLVLLWNLALLTNPEGKAPFKLFVIASVSLITAIWLLIYAVPDVRFRADHFGMMVSFFVLALPTVLAWEALMDGRPVKTNTASLNRIVRIAVVVLISIASGIFAIIQGSVMWIT